MLDNQSHPVQPGPGPERPGGKSTVREWAYRLHSAGYQELIIKPGVLMHTSGPSYFTGVLMHTAGPSYFTDVLMHTAGPNCWS